MKQLFQKIEPAEINWENGTPVSVSYGDIYYSRDDGLDETRYIFLGLNELEQRWQELQPGESFCIAETGFGTGLNFLAASRLWLETTPETCQLHFISIEKHPLARDDLERALETWPELEKEARELLCHYPPMTPGYHRRHLFNNRIHLTLIYEDILDCMPDASWKADAWFLDGFAPSGNPDMWSEKALGHIGRLSSVKATAATFTVAGFVRRELQAQGFEIEKVPGHGKKKQVLLARRQDTGNPGNIHHRFDDKPWFQYPSESVKDKTVTIIGAGLAGCSMAHALAKRHWEVKLLDASGNIAEETSGNHTGIIYTRFSPHNSPQNRFYQQSFLYTSELIAGLDLGENWDNCGVLQIAFEESEAEKQNELIENNHCPLEVLRHLSVTESEAITGFKAGEGILLQKGGWVHPPALCRKLAGNSIVNFSGNSFVEKIEYDNKNQQWLSYDSNGTLLASSSVLVIANALAANNYEQTSWLPLKPISGQVSYLEKTKESSKLSTVVCYDGYTAPAYKGIHSTGATFHLGSSSKEVTGEDHETNLEKLKRDFPEFRKTIKNATGGRTGIRCQTPDYIPIAGRIPDISNFEELYGKYKSGQRKGNLQAPEYYPGLYALTGLGSRGICFAPYAAEIIASQVNNEALPVDLQVAQHLAPVRFAIRDILKKRKDT